AFIRKFVVEAHHPFPGRLVPDELWVAPVMLHHRVAAGLLPTPATVIAVSQTLAPSSAGEGGHEHIGCARLPAGGVLFIHDCAAGKHPISEGAGIERDRQL